VIPSRSAASRQAAGSVGPPTAPEDVAEHVAARIRLALSEPYQIGGVGVTVGASVGTAVAPADGGDIDALLHAADVAMYAVKASRRMRGPTDINLTPSAASILLVDAGAARWVGESPPVASLSGQGALVRSAHDPDPAGSCPPGTAVPARPVG
jgi:hypothetical protein